MMTAIINAFFIYEKAFKYNFQQNDLMGWEEAGKMEKKIRTTLEYKVMLILS